MSAEIYYLEDYREPLTFERREQLEQRLADIAVEMALLDSEADRINRILEGGE